MGKERRGRRREGKEDEGGEKEGLLPLEWRSGYAPGPNTFLAMGAIAIISSAD